MEKLKRLFFSLVAFLITVLLVMNLKVTRIVDNNGVDTTTSALHIEVTCNTTEIRVPNKMVSTCSKEATKRGPHQRVVSFCIYGAINVTKESGRNYFKGIEANLVLVEKLYPGWIMRLYHDIPYNRTDAIGILNSFKRRFKNFDLCNCTQLPDYGNIVGIQQNIWRFLPMGDPLVDVFLSRDLDSRISDREVKAVEEWLVSGLTFHVMRDHPYHSVPIPAGMWGARPEGARELLLTLMAQMFVRGRRAKLKGQDQFLLAAVTWPAMRGLTMQHDSYICQSFRKHGGMRPWPTKRLSPNETKLTYVGAIYTKNPKPLLKSCPTACRPEEHQDWTLC